VVAVANRRDWNALGKDQRKRYLARGKKLGWSPQRIVGHYKSGKSLKDLRGHGATPERPAEAQRHPERFAEYRKGQSQEIPVTVKDIGVVWVAGLNERDRSKVASHHNAIIRYLDTGNDRALVKFEGKTVGGYNAIGGGERIPKYELETRLSPLEQWGTQGQFDYPTFYREVA
jgi:hypothetical protein